MKYNCLEFALYDLAAFLDELDKLEFDVIFEQNGSIVIYDRNLKTNAGYMVFSKEKVK